MKTLYKHVHLVIDDKREYLDGSILIEDGIIKDVFIHSNKSFDDVKEINMKGKIFIPSFFDSKSKIKKQKGISKRFVCSNKILNEPTHLITDKEVKNKNVFAVTRIKNTKKAKGVKTFFNPSCAATKNINAVSDITKQMNVDLNSNKLINYVLNNNCYIEFGIDKKLSDNYIKFILKNIESNHILLISFSHDDIINQIKRLRKLNVSLTDIVAMTSINPYTFYGSKKQDGYLIKGKPANIVCLNDNMNIEFVLDKGERYA